MVEHSLGKGEVESSILSGSTIDLFEGSKVLGFSPGSSPVLRIAATPGLHRRALAGSVLCHADLRLLPGTFQHVRRQLFELACLEA